MSEPATEDRLCEHCDKPLLLEDDREYGMHEDCEDYYVRCVICAQWFPRDDSTCRHLFYAGDVGFSGCGVGEDPDLEELVPGLAIFLRITGDAAVLRDALDSRTYWFQYLSGLLGGSELLFRGGEFGARASRSYDQRLFEDLAEDGAERLKYAVGWLVSLWCEDEPCRKYELLFVRLIDEWIAAQPGKNAAGWPLFVGRS